MISFKDKTVNLIRLDYQNLAFMKYTGLKGSFLFFIIFTINWLPVYFAAEQKNGEITTYSKNLNLEPKYRLGPGDVIRIEVFQLPDFSTVTKILPDGYVNLPRVKSVYLNEHTIDEAINKIKSSYSKILRTPVIYLDIVEERPIRFTIIGEVQRPGFYSLGLNETNKLANTDGGEETFINSRGWPTLIDAIQKANGITTKADLRIIKIKRKDISKKITEEIIVNYWEALKNGTMVNNPKIYDGDIISIERINKNMNYNEALLISSSNVSPASITINVVGEVVRPGNHNLLANSPLSSAIYSAGGTTRRANIKKVNLYRLNRNGSIEISSYPFSLKEKSKISKNNPPLQDGDVIEVKRNVWSASNDFLRDSVQPISPILNAFTFMKIINND